MCPYPEWVAVTYYFKVRDGAELRFIFELGFWCSRCNGGSDVVVVPFKDDTIVSCCFLGKFELEGWWFEGWVLLLEYCDDGLYSAVVSIVKCLVCVSIPLSDGGMACYVCQSVPYVLSM